MPSVPRVKFIKTMVIFRYHTKGVSNQVSSNSVNKIKSELQNGAIRELQIGADFRDYKSEQEVLQIGAALAISNQGKKIANWGRDFKSGQSDFKLEQRLQIGARGNSNRDKDYKSRQGLPIGAEKV